VGSRQCVLTRMKRKRTNNQARSIRIDCGACHCRSALDVSDTPRSEDSKLREAFIVCGDCDAAMRDAEEAGRLIYFQSHFEDSVVLNSSHSCVKISKYLNFERTPFIERPLEESITAAAALLRRAGAVIVLAGSGMSADSGLSTFRPVASDRGLGGPVSERPTGNMHLLPLEDACYTSKPEKAWYYDAGYRRSSLSAEPHRGYTLLLEMLEHLQIPWFVVTTNIDNYFAKAGFPQHKVYETHGNTGYLQCSKRGAGRCPGCFEWPADSPLPSLNDQELICDISTVPCCVSCGGLARMNISHLPDDPDDVDTTRKSIHKDNAKYWLAEQRQRLKPMSAKKSSGEEGDTPELLVLEIGSGDTEHGIRGETDLLLSKHPYLGFYPSASLIRINPDAGVHPSYMAEATADSAERHHSHEQKSTGGYCDTTTTTSCCAIPTGAFEALKSLSLEINNPVSTTTTTITTTINVINP
jgi:NAD-dependent SIR2 family protein deacetylase